MDTLYLKILSHTSLKEFPVFAENIPPQETYIAWKDERGDA